MGGLFFTAAAGFGIALQITKRRGIKFIDGKRHMFEHFARIIGGRRNTFLFGNGIFRTVDEILRGTFNTNHRKETE